MDPIAAASLVVSVAGTALSTSISIAAWRAAHRSATADQMTSRIEAARWHEELTPQFTATATTTNINRADLWLELTGPVALRNLAEIAVSIQAGSPALLPPSASRGGPTADELAAQVWGAYQFSPYADGADAHGRTVHPFALRVGERRQLSLMKTRAPFWTSQSDEQWQRQWAGEPVRLELHCRRDDSTAPWVVPVQVLVTPPPPPPA